MKTVPFSGTLVFFGFMSFVSARINGQFEHFYPSYADNLREIFATNCSKEFNKMRANPSLGGYWTVKCALEHFHEMKKAEMAVCSVILGLLPVALQLIGPKLSDVCILALQRPVLSFLITIGSPCATLNHERTGLTLDHERTGQEPDRQVKHKPLWPEFLINPPLWVKTSISLVEYSLVGLAAANCLVQAYQLTFWAIALVSTSTGTFGHTLEAFSPILWVLLTVPIHAFGVCALHLSQKLSRERQSTEGTNLQQSFTVSGMVIRVKDSIALELTPCAYQRRVAVLNEARPSYRLLVLDWAIKLGVWTQVIMGVIVLSSVIFVSLWQTLEIVGRFLAGSIVCRVVLAFELYSARKISEAASDTGTTRI